MVEPIDYVGHPNVGKLREQFSDMFAERPDEGLFSMFLASIVICYGIVELHVRVSEIVVKIAKLV